MRRLVGAAVIAAYLSATLGAITYGVPDNDDHPNVGLLIAIIPQGAFAICSGVLVSPTVFLTAGHCTALLDELNAATFVSFSSGPPFHIVSGTPHTYPGYDGTLPDTGDIGVVVLDRAITGIEPATVASEGLLDEFATQRGLRDIYFTHVGYGAQSVRPMPLSVVQRYQGISSLINLRSALADGYNVQTTSNPGRGRSGVCFGDSGGPAFFEDTSLVVAIHSFTMNENCKGAAFSYRVDTAGSLEFLAQFGVVPAE